MEYAFIGGRWAGVGETIARAVDRLPGAIPLIIVAASAGRDDGGRGELMRSKSPALAQLDDARFVYLCPDRPTTAALPALPARRPEYRRTGRADWLRRPRVIERHSGEAGLRLSALESCWKRASSRGRSPPNLSLPRPRRWSSEAAGLTRFQPAGLQARAFRDSGRGTIPSHCIGRAQAERRKGAARAGTIPRERSVARVMGASVARAV